MKCFKDALCYVEGRGIIKTNISFDKNIEKIGDIDASAEEIALPSDAVVLPGFIDEHIHGAGNCDAMDASEGALATIAKTVAKEGTVGFLATTMTQSRENILAAMKAVKAYNESEHDGAELLGVHLEGPFISAAHKGAQPLEYVAKPDIAVFDEYNSASGNAIKIVTLAPEEEGAQELIAHLVSRGIVASIGHTGAKYNDISAAVANGAKNVTHTYNAQSALHHRDIGTVGSALLLDELACELIADTIHVSVPAIKLLLKCKKHEGLILITDAMRAKGLGDGESELGGQKVFVKNGEARLADGTLAGSVLCMNRAVQNMVEKVGMSLEDACNLASLNPATALGMEKERGSIKQGKRADFTIIDKEFNVLYTICNGNIIYENTQS